MTDYADRFPALLPFGVTIDETLVRDFEVLKVDGVFEDIFTHQRYAARHPQRWMGRCAAAILGTLGTLDMRAKFRATDFKEIPSELRSMTLHDISYILLCGHVHTYGPKLAGLGYDCTTCGHKAKMDINLKDVHLNIDRDTPHPQSVTADLPDGWRKAAVQGKPTSGVEDITWNRYVFAVPQYRHAEENEVHFSAKALAEFNLRIAQSALLSVHATRTGEGGRPTETHTMTREDLAMYRRSLCLDLLGSDRQAIRRAFTTLDVLKLQVESECGRCGEELQVRVEVSDLYPLA